MQDRIREIVQRVSDTPAFKRVIAGLDQSPGTPIAITGVLGSLLAIFLAAIRESTGRTLLFVAAERGSAERVCDDLRILLESESVHIFGDGHGRERQSQDLPQTDEGGH